jgi:ABC-type glycerol-3-phosphate transport system substrate-binding protein
MENTEDKIAKDTLILLQGYFSNLYDYQYTMARFNEPAICVGFPSVEGSGTFIGGSGVALGMNAGSNKKEGVWEFIRYFLTEEASENAWGLPVNKKAYAKMIEENMTPTYFENPEDIYIPLEKQKITEDGRVEMPVNTIYYGDTEEYIYAASQEEADAFTALYESTNSLATYDMEILNILLEEADSYFSGQKNVEAVADIIQSRLQIYVNENK